MKARKLLVNGCRGYLANVVELSRKEKLTWGDVPVVRDFIEVFPEELSGLPPNRAITFEIELMLGTAPISKAPYSMALAELKELQVQLQELLDRGFVHSSYSPWGALVFF